MTDMIRPSTIRPSHGIAWPEVVRHCADCGSDQPFEQHHQVPESCPDSGDGNCPEWSCTVCGAALLIGFIPFAVETAGYPEARGRVA